MSIAKRYVLLSREFWVGKDTVLPREKDTPKVCRLGKEGSRERAKISKPDKGKTITRR